MCGPFSIVYRTEVNSDCSEHSASKKASCEPSPYRRIRVNGETWIASLVWSTEQESLKTPLTDLIGQRYEKLIADAVRDIIRLSFY
jgi:hypothetical protein